MIPALLFIFIFLMHWCSVKRILKNIFFRSCLWPRHILALKSNFLWIRNILTFSNRNVEGFEYHLLPGDQSIYLCRRSLKLTSNGRLVLAHIMYIEIFFLITSTLYVIICHKHIPALFSTLFQLIFNYFRSFFYPFCSDPVFILFSGSSLFPTVSVSSVTLRAFSKYMSPFRWLSHLRRLFRKNLSPFSHLFFGFCKFLRRYEAKMSIKLNRLIDFLIRFGYVFELNFKIGNSQKIIVSYSPH